MKTFITQKQPWKKIVLAALATATVAPLTTFSAQAAPPDNAPAYGYRNKDDKDKGNKKPKKNKVIRDRDNDGYDDRDRDRDGDFDEDDGYDYRDTQAYKRRYDETNTNFRDANRNGVDDREETNNRNSRSITVTGTFVRDLPGNRFEMRASNGSNYTVMTRSNAPVRLTRGEPVTVSGRIVGNSRFIIADRVRTRGNNYDPTQNAGRVNFTGTVTSVRSDRELQVRSEGGRVYTVRTNARLSSSIDRGDRVRVTGRLRSNVVEDGSVQLLSNNDWDDNDDNYSGTVNFEGRVQSRSNTSADRILLVRADNGTTYRVRLNTNTRFDYGDRVRVSGRLRNGIVDASRIVLIDGDNDNNGSGNIDFRGHVESSRSFLGQRILTVRADNGTSYRVRYSGSERYDNGDYIRVRGDLRSGIVIANDIDRL